MTRQFTIAPVRSSDQLSSIVDLFRAYEASLDVDLAYQDFAAELTGLPGPYAPPKGELLLARMNEKIAVGCVAMRALGTARRCEMKRLYVAPEGRGLGLGKALVNELILVAKCRGYEEMWLDTLPTMASAQRLYAQLGFEPASAYYETPIAGTVFMRLELTR